MKKRFEAIAIVFIISVLGCSSTETEEIPTATLEPIPTLTPPPQLNLENLFIRVQEGDVVNNGGMSRGVAWGDYDGDGYVDIFVANSSDQINFLYQNNGDGSFTRITEGEMVETASNSEGAAWIDYDNDGDVDLFVANREEEPNFLFNNDGNGTFTRILEGEIVSEAFSSTGSCWIDLDNDGHLDVFVTNRDGQDNSLFRNDGAGNFIKISEGIIVSDAGDSRACGWADVDLDGDWDLFVGNAHERNAMYLNDGNGDFSKVSESDLLTRSDYTYGLSWADFDNDGDLDLFVANVTDGGSRYNELFENEGGGEFSKIDLEPITNDIGPSKGNAWGDLENDGDIDLFVANGTPGVDVRNFIYLNDGTGIFSRVEVGIISSDSEISAGAALADYDGNGSLDIFVANWQNEDWDNALYQNQNTLGEWIKITAVGLQSNRSAIGTRVRVLARIGGQDIWQERIIQSNTGYGSQNSLIVHFGLGDAKSVLEVEIHWPSGLVDHYTNLEAARHYIVWEGQEITISGEE